MEKKFNDMTQEELDKILNGLDKKAYSMIRSWLFDKANEFAVNKEGSTAVLLHGTCNKLIPVIERIEPDYFRD